MGKNLRRATPLNRHERWNRARDAIAHLCCSRLTVDQLLYFFDLCLGMRESRFGPEDRDIEVIETLARELGVEPDTFFYDPVERCYRQPVPQEGNC